MTERVVAVMARPNDALAPPLVAAMLSDVIDLVADTPQVDAALAATPGYDVTAESLSWPGTTIVAVPPEPMLGEVFEAIAGGESGWTAIAVVAADVPDLPTLHLGKLFSAMAGPRGASVAICPASGGGLVAAATTLPVPDWLRSLPVGLDDTDALDRIRAASPAAGLSVVAGWHRIRTADDLAGLDLGLEGWDSTRAHLGV